MGLLEDGRLVFAGEDLDVRELRTTDVERVLSARRDVGHTPSFAKTAAAPLPPGNSIPTKRRPAFNPRNDSGVKQRQEPTEPASQLSWALAGPNSEVRRDGAELLFGIEQKAPSFLRAYGAAQPPHGIRGIARITAPNRIAERHRICSCTSSDCAR